MALDIFPLKLCVIKVKMYNNVISVVFVSLAMIRLREELLEQKSTVSISIPFHNLYTGYKVFYHIRARLELHRFSLIFGYSRVIVCSHCI